MSNITHPDYVKENDIRYTHDEELAKHTNGYLCEYKIIHMKTKETFHQKVFMASDCIQKFYELLNNWNRNSTEWKFYANSGN
jgi:hypothetical protein